MMFKPEGFNFQKFNGFKRDVLYRLMESGAVAQAPAYKSDDALNLYIDLGKDAYGVIPVDEFERSVNGAPTKSVAVISRVGKFTSFVIKSIDTDEDGKLRCALSRKEAQDTCYREYISKLSLGEVIDARVTHTEKYGAFCDIGCGIVALLPVENFCVVRLADPKKALMEFRNIKVFIKSFEEDGKILLSHKELLGTFTEEVSKFEVGSVVLGKVRLVKDYGIFVELTPNLAGLAEVTDGVRDGDVVSVFIKSIIPEKMKVKLAIIDHACSSDTIKPTKLEYKIPEDNRVTHWVYSPEGANKVVETIIKA